ncbi:MAG TPA: hypothetical protein VK854_08130 [Woeseiaceae bacterium]|nr:hypothetical protein [Woeseiaceae bacterium]
MVELVRAPKKYTCDGIDVSPPLSIGNVPEKTKSLALIVDDPDAPVFLQDRIGCPIGADQSPAWQLQVSPDLVCHCSR